MIVINKMDADNVDFPGLVETVQELFGKACIPLNVPIGHGGGFKGVASALAPPDKTDGALMDVAAVHESLVEAIIEVDDAVTERYFEGQMPTAEELSRLIVEAVAAGTLIPIVATSAKTGAGINELLDALAACALAARHAPAHRQE